MFCSSCNKKITENSRFCKYCGVSQVETEGKEEKKTKKEDSIATRTCYLCGETFDTKSDKKRHINKELLNKLVGTDGWYVFQITSEPGEPNLTDLSRKLGFSTFRDFWEWLKSLSTSEIREVTDEWCHGDCCQSLLRKLLETVKTHEIKTKTSFFISKK